MSAGRRHEDSEDEAPEHPLPACDERLLLARVNNQLPASLPAGAPLKDRDEQHDQRLLGQE